MDFQIPCFPCAMATLKFFLWGHGHSWYCECVIFMPSEARLEIFEIRILKFTMEATDLH